MGANQWLAVDRVYQEVRQSRFADEQAAREAKAKLKCRLISGSITSARKKPVRIRKLI